MKRVFLALWLMLCITSCDLVEGSKESQKSIFDRKQLWNDAHQTAKDILVLRCGGKKCIIKDELDALTRRIVKCRSLLETAKGEQSDYIYNGKRSVYLKQYEGECIVSYMG